jgi:type IV secretory pathway VirB3-like protein
VILGVFAYLWARKMGRNDEHRLLQMMMRMRMRGPQGNARKFWGAVSFSPHRPRK